MTLLFTVVGCDNHKPIKIGFIGGLSGRTSDLGGAARDGALLAIDEVNRQNGVHGRQVEMVFKDDRQDVTVLKSVLDELRIEDVRLVIGPMTSQMALAAVEATEDGTPVFVSPTASTPLLSGLDDNFFRTYPQSVQLIDRLAQHVVTQTSVRKACVIADVANATFTIPSIEQFKSTFEILGGTVSKPITFNANTTPNFSNIAKEIDFLGCSGVVAIASAVDLAMICQQMAKLKIKRPVFTTEWAYSEDLIELGGKSVEDLTLVHTFNQNSQTTSSKRFTNNFEERFGYLPTFSALQSFDATKMVLAALQSAPNDKFIPALKNMGDFAGVQTGIKFDKYGDVLRDIFLSKIVDGRFVQKQRL